MNRPFDPSRRAAPALAALAALAALGGCATSTSEWDKTFGDATRQLRAQQLIDPDAPTRNQGVAPAVDGRSTREATDRYVDSFKAPPATNVINIGVGGGGAGTR